MAIPQGDGREEFDISHYRRNGNYYQIHQFGIATTTGSYSPDILNAAPYITTKTATLISIGIEVTTLGAGNARIGIYDDNGNLYPNNLILDAGTVDVSSTGVKTIAISRTLNKGLYWLCMVSNVTFSSEIMVRPISILGYPGSDFSNNNLFWQAAFTYAALPATFPVGGTIQKTVVPAILVSS